MAFIYKVTNKINGKAYIGATITSVQSRWNRHVCDSKHDRTGQALHAAINKYGRDNFIVETLIEHPDDQYVFDVLEKQYIQEHKTHGSEGGYNMTLGGDGWLGLKHTEETKQKISKANTGKKRTTEERQAQSERQKGKPTWNKGLECPQISNAKKGVRCTEEAKKAFSKSHSGIKQDQTTKDKIRDKNSESHTVRHDSSGEFFNITNLSKFCKDRSLSQGSLKTCGHTKGYTLLQTTKKIRTYIIQNIDTNEIFTTTNLAQFCKPLNISNSGLLNKHKRNKPYLNWKILKIDITEETHKYLT